MTIDIENTYIAHCNSHTSGMYKYGTMHLSVIQWIIKTPEFVP
jgi:hypothetical protein